MLLCTLNFRKFNAVIVLVSLLKSSWKEKRPAKEITGRRADWRLGTSLLEMMDMGAKTIIVTDGHSGITELPRRLVAGRKQELSLVIQDGTSAKICNWICKNTRGWISSSPPRILLSIGWKDFSLAQLSKLSKKKDVEENIDLLAIELSQKFLTPITKLADTLEENGSCLWVASLCPRLKNMDHPHPISLVLNLAFALANYQINKLNIEHGLPILPINKHLYKPVQNPVYFRHHYLSHRYTPDRQNLNEKAKHQVMRTLLQYLRKQWKVGVSRSTIVTPPGYVPFSKRKHHQKNHAVRR